MMDGSDIPATDGGVQKHYRVFRTKNSKFKNWHGRQFLNFEFAHANIVGLLTGDVHVATDAGLKKHYLVFHAFASESKTVANASIALPLPTAPNFSAVLALTKT